MAINWYTVKPFTNSVTQSWIDIGHGVDFKIISNTMHLRHWTSPLSEKLKHIYTYLPLLTGHYSWLFRIRKQQITVIRASTIHFTSHQSPKNVRFSSSRLHHYHFEFLTSCVQTGAKFSSSLVTATEVSEMRGASLVWIPLSNAAIKTQLQLLLHRKKPSLHHPRTYKTTKTIFEWTSRCYVDGFVEMNFLKASKFLKPHFTQKTFSDVCTSPSTL